jgi:hypothetical protein
MSFKSININILENLIDITAANYNRTITTIIDCKLWTLKMKKRFILINLYNSAIVFDISSILYSHTCS